jgi:hypothetical protein
MKDMGDEFEEFETTEDEIDGMMAAGEPVQVTVTGERYIDTLYVVTGVPLTQGGASMTPNIGSVSPSVQIAAPVRQFAETVS